MRKQGNFRRVGSLLLIVVLVLAVLPVTAHAAARDEAKAAILEAYEKKLGFELCYVDPHDAFEVNIVIAEKRGLNFLLRESQMLSDLRDKGICGL